MILGYARAVKTSLWIRHSMLEDFDLKTIQDLDGARQAILKLLNLVEELASDNRGLREENQRLRDENNRLKGEQGKPQIKPDRVATSSASKNHSSERERHKPGPSAAR